MGQATSKNPAIDRMLRSVFGIDRVGSISRNVCAICGKPVTGSWCFRDEFSAHEYNISGMCQACQDKNFGFSDDD